MKCEICHREVGEEGVIVKTKGIVKGVEYHLECFDDMWSTFDEMRNKVCGCCGEDLRLEEIDEGQEKCFPCLKGNCQNC